MTVVTSARDKLLRRGPAPLHNIVRLIVSIRMAAFHSIATGPRVLLALALSTICATVWTDRVRAQSQAQIGVSSPLPVFVTNPSDAALLPEGFVSGSRWRFTTWTLPSVFTWTARVNRVNGPWANLTIAADDGSTTTRWYYIAAMPGSWERQ